MQNIAESKHIYSELQLVNALEVARMSEHKVAHCANMTAEFALTNARPGFVFETWLSVFRTYADCMGNQWYVVRHNRSVELRGETRRVNDLQVEEAVFANFREFQASPWFTLVEADLVPFMEDHGGLSRGEERNSAPSRSKFEQRVQNVGRLTDGNFYNLGAAQTVVIDCDGGRNHIHIEVSDPEDGESVVWSGGVMDLVELLEREEARREADAVASGEKDPEPSLDDALADDWEW